MQLCRASQVACDIGAGHRDAIHFDFGLNGLLLPSHFGFGSVVSEHQVVLRPVGDNVDGSRARP